MAAPRSILRPKTHPRTGLGRDGPRKNDAPKSQKAKNKEQDAALEPEESAAVEGLPNALSAKKKRSSAQAPEKTDSAALDSRQSRRTVHEESFETSFQGSKESSFAKAKVKSSPAAFLPHSPAAHLHRLSAFGQKEIVPRNRVNDLAAAFSTQETHADLFDFGEALLSLVEKVEAGAYRHRDIRIPLSQLEFPNDKTLAQLFAPDAQAPKATADVKGMRTELLSLMQRLSAVQGNAILLPSWPVRVKELNALWHMQNAQLAGDAPSVQKWATTLLKAAPEGPFADFARSQLPATPATAQEIIAVKKALSPTGEVAKLCSGLKNLAQQMSKQMPKLKAQTAALSRASQKPELSLPELNAELEKLPNPAGQDLTALWTDAGEKMRQDLHQGLQELAAAFPDAILYETQTLKEAALYSTVLETQFAVEQGSGPTADLHAAAKNLIDAFPQSERSQWVAQLMLE